MFKPIFNKYFYLVGLTLAIGFTANAKTFTAYKGTYTSSLVDVSAANIVTLMIDVAPGYPRRLKITLPGISVPVDFDRAPACHTELIAKGLAFTNEFMSQATKIDTKDIKMKNTSEDGGLSVIYTNNGSLSSALLREGLALPGKVDPDKPWC